MSPETAAAVLAGVLGALVGSFANVVIFRLPAGESVAYPPSRCPSCGKRLGPLELVPILSWLAQRGRCRGCGAPVSARYPLVEALAALGFVLLALAWPPLDHPVAFAATATWWTVLLVAAFVDLDTYQIPDVLTLPGTALALAASFAWAGAPGLPAPREAVLGALLGAGILTAINRLGALALRRFADTRERLWPIGFDQANVAALAGALGGFGAGLAAAAASLVVNLVSRRTVRLPEAVAWGGWLVALLVAPFTIGTLPALVGGLAACGAAALAGAATWWAHDRLRGDEDAADGAPGGDEDVPLGTGDDLPRDEEGEPVAMGFGDVKLAALLGAVLGPVRLVVALFLAVLVGAVVGVLQRAAGGTRAVPFGPFLALGGALALLVGGTLADAYLGLIGVGGVGEPW